MRQIQKNEKSLFTETREFHHACEQHPVGASMSDGDINDQWWADWCSVLLSIHEVIDPELPEILWRKEHLKIDVSSCKKDPRPNNTAIKFVEELKTRPLLREASHYVITGAHLMGGQVMRMTIGPRLPNAHLHFKNRNSIVDIWKPYRDRLDLAEDAKEVFSWLLKIMDEIKDK